MFPPPFCPPPARVRPPHPSALSGPLCPPPPSFPRAIPTNFWLSKALSFLPLVNLALDNGGRKGGGVSGEPTEWVRGRQSCNSSHKGEIVSLPSFFLLSSSFLLSAVMGVGATLPPCRCSQVRSPPSPLQHAGPRLVWRFGLLRFSRYLKPQLLNCCYFKNKMKVKPIWLSLQCEKRPRELSTPRVQ